MKGSAQTSDDLKEKFAQDIVLFLWNKTHIWLFTEELESVSFLINLIFHHLLLMDTDICKDSMRVVEMVLSGEINKISLY